MTTPRTELSPTYDFVAVGSGVAGLVGAIEARDRGLRAVVLEKSSLLGGVTSYSQGQLWVPASDQESAAGIEDSADEGFDYMMRLGVGQSDPSLARVFVDNAPQVLRYLTDRHGLQLRLVNKLADYYYPTFPTAKPDGRYLEAVPVPGAALGELRPLLRTARHLPYHLSHRELFALGPAARSHTWDAAVVNEATEQDLLALGTGLSAQLVLAAHRAGVVLAIGAHVVDVTYESGRVTGVVLADGRTIRARAGVLLAMGGYDWDTARTQSYEGHAGMISAAPPSVSGDHLSIGSRIGAATAQYAKSLRLGLPVPGESDDGEPLNQMVGAAAMPHAILVDRRGRRFGDESFYPSIGYAMRDIDGARQEFRHWPCWIVFDEQFRRRYRIGPAVPGTPFPEQWQVVEAPSLRELALAAGIDPDGLVDEVRRFNAFCATGRDEDFGRGERPWSRLAYGDPSRHEGPNLGPLTEGPFYALRPSLIGVGIPSHGLVTDEWARVASTSGGTIAGLYAAGNSSALAEVGGGYQSGVANTRSAVFGFRSGEHAADTMPR